MPGSRLCRRSLSAAAVAFPVTSLAILSSTAFPEVVSSPPRGASQLRILVLYSSQVLRGDGAYSRITSSE